MSNVNLTVNRRASVLPQWSPELTHCQDVVQQEIGGVNVQLMNEKQEEEILIYSGWVEAK